MSYNGWSNYPTWCVALWIDNDEAMQDEAGAIVHESGGATAESVDRLKSYIEDETALVAPAVFEASFVADLYSYAISEVDWYEVASHLAEDIEDAS